MYLGVTSVGRREPTRLVVVQLLKWMTVALVSAGANYLAPSGNDRAYLHTVVRGLKALS